MSLAKFPRVFDKVTINVVSASEDAGTLKLVFKDLKKQVKQDIEFQSKIRSGLFYPLLVLVVFIAILLIILIVVIPKISSVFSQMQIAMPLSTKILVGISDILLNHTWAVILGIVLVILGIAAAFRFKREWVLTRIYSLPLISSIVQEIDVANFARSMHLLLISGISITKALDLMQGVAFSPQIDRAIRYCKTKVNEGKDLSEAMEQNRKYFPNIMITLVEAGEQTGSLDSSMNDIAEYYSGKAEETLKTFSNLLEPFMITVVGIIVGGVMLSIIGPIYGLIGQIGGR